MSMLSRSSSAVRVASTELTVTTGPAQLEAAQSAVGGDILVLHTDGLAENPNFDVARLACQPFRRWDGPDVVIQGIEDADGHAVR